MTVGIGRPTRTPAREPRRPAGAAPGLIIVIASAGHVVASKCGERREEARVTEHAEHAAEHIANQIGRYGDALYGIRGLVAASDEVTHREFHDATDATAIELLPDDQTVLDWLPLVGGLRLAVLAFWVL